MTFVIFDFWSQIRITSIIVLIQYMYITLTSYLSELDYKYLGNSILWYKLWFLWISDESKYTIKI